MNMEKDQLFSNMLGAALKWLEGQDPREISRRTGAYFDGKAFHLESLGIPVTVFYPAYTVVPELAQWHVLTLLHYLAKADGMPVTGQQITFAQHKEGMVRGGGFDRDVEKAIQTKLGKLPSEELERRCLALGGNVEPSNADLCARFSFAPNYPVWLKIWFADEEFPASGRLLLDATAEHSLSIEDAVTVGSLILNRLVSGGM